MNLRRSDGLSLAFSSVMMSSSFSDAAKKYMHQCPHTAVHGGTPFTSAALNIGTYIWRDWGDTHFKLMYCCVSCLCGTKLLFILSSNRKVLPRLRPSDRWRLTVIGLKVFSYFWLDEDVLTLATWATIASWPAWPFHLFTDVSPIDVTSTESGLVCYSFLNCYFHHAYK
jgi:hypothetical protein